SELGFKTGTLSLAAGQMATPTVVKDTHYTVVDKKKGRVRCNYCGKEVSGSTRLKQHLGGIPPDVLPCLKVPDDVKVQMKNNLMGRTKADANTKFPKSFKSCTLRKRKSSSNDLCKGNHVSSLPASLSRKRKHHTTTESGLKHNDEMARSLINPEQLNADTAGEIEKQAEDKSSRQIQRCIGRFFFENGIDFNAANSPTFQKMMHAFAGHGSTLYKVPSCNDLKGWILQEELKASQEYVGEVVHSWGTTGSHCIGLILEKIGMLDPWRGVLDKAKDITKFIYTHETVLKLMTKHTSGVELVSSRRIRSLSPFLILERIESQKNNLKIMFSSLEWKSSALASTADGVHVTDLVTGVWSFWTEAQMLLKGSLPLICALHLISGGDSKPQLGYIYDIMDQVKETIKEEYEDEKTKYQPFWTVIDGIWNNQLHSPIHSAACILNPSLLYSSEDVDDDNDIKDGLLRCIEGMVKDKRARDLILLQLNDYLVASGAFGEGVAIDQKTKLSPVKWWSLYGGHCPELQSFAIRILSQTCTGASRYGLKRSLSEQLHMNGRNPVEQKQLTDLTFVHHNFRLQNAVSISNTDYRDIFLEEMDPMDEWVGGGDVV
ncbi:hypothetical protein MKW98_003721, partial [Papaver atlanticum]